jgi:hypothetical protein
MGFVRNILSKSAVGALGSVMVLAGAMTASAATLSGTFNVVAVNKANLNSAQSQASRDDFLAAQSGDPTLYNVDDFSYTGALNFGTSDGTDATTILDWLNTGGGVISGLDAGFGALQLSKPNISNGTATSTFFQFVMEIDNPVTEFAVRHDDGIGIYDDGGFLGGFQNPTSVKNTSVFGFDGGEFQLIYVATNGDPSILEVSAVPLPAGGLLLLTALGGVAALRRKRKAA